MDRLGKGPSRTKILACFGSTRFSAREPQLSSALTSIKAGYYLRWETGRRYLQDTTSVQNNPKNGGRHAAAHLFSEAARRPEICNQSHALHHPERACSADPGTGDRPSLRCTTTSFRCRTPRLTRSLKRWICPLASTASPLAVDCGGSRSTLATRLKRSWSIAALLTSAPIR